ncbi:hypothetical protein L3V65_01510 [Heyndrickxia coagulans]|uniref:hypothetical protein n=1 Tax=Heyndrickxia coagulans TaxID=1398 RepID=UPI0018A7404A|nr:hypothetical protein [Heyndrickxia coagulans]MBF8419085.1 hypothetical protein [Heyndrickxia coagulans]UJZ87744.1 hypothetical protein L3V65_01510 [Heyndrickxia coagulans]
MLIAEPTMSAAPAGFPPRHIRPRGWRRITLGKKKWQYPEILYFPCIQHIACKKSVETQIAECLNAFSILVVLFQALSF